MQGRAIAMAPSHAAAPIHTTAPPTELTASGNGLDLLLAIGLLAGGMLAFALNKAGGMLAPNVEGGLTTSVLAVALCKAARLPYRTAAVTVLAIVMIELAAGLAAGMRAVEIIAYPLVALGLLGLFETRQALRRKLSHASTVTSRHRSAPGLIPSRN
jgi:hypothetical protein